MVCNPGPFNLTDTDGGTRPVTTIFTPPPDCSTRLPTLYDGDCGGGPNPQLDAVLDDRGTLTCSPSEFVGSSKDVNINIVVTAKGVCPQGYTTYGTRVIQADEYNIQTYSLPRTLAYCCMSGWTATLVQNRLLECHSGFSNKQVLIMTSRAGDNGYGSINGTSKLSGKYTVYDRGYVLSWDSNDLESFTPASAPILNTQSVTLLVPSSPPSPSNSDSSTPHLPGRIIAGIVVGAIAFLVSILISWWLIASHRRHNRKLIQALQQIQPQPANQVAGHTAVSETTPRQEAAQELQPKSQQMVEATVTVPSAAADDEEVKRLRDQQRRLQERRKLLEEMQQLDEEEGRLNRALRDRIAKIQSGGSGSGASESTR